MQVGDFHRQGLGSQAKTVTDGAVAVVLIPLKILANPVGFRLAIAALHIRDNPFEGARNFVNSPALVIAKLDLLIHGPIKHDHLRFLWQVTPRGGGFEFVVLGNRLYCLHEIRRFTFRPRCKSPLVKADALVRYDQATVEVQFNPEATTIRTSPERRVEGKQTGFDLGDGKSADRTGVFFGKHVALGALVRNFQHSDAVGKVQSRTEAIRQAPLHPWLNHHAVYNHVDVMAELFVERRRFLKLVKLAVNLNTLETLLAKLGEFLAVFAFAIPHDGGQQIGTRPLLHRSDPVHHVRNLLRFDRQTSRWRIRCANASKQQAHIVVDFRDRANGGARVLRCGLLFNRNRR